MPETRSKKKASPHKALKTPRSMSPKGSPATPKKAKSKRKRSEGRMDRMEEQIVALTSLITSQLTMEAQAPQLESPPREKTPKKKLKQRTRHTAFPPPPEAMAAAPGIQEYINEAIKQLDPTYKTTGGKRADPTITAKPHLFIPKRFRDPGLKASEQEDIPFPHFVTGMAGMVLSMLDDQASLVPALESTVREWSKTLFDRLQLGEIEWDDYAEMRNERIKIYFSAPPKVTTIIPCPFYSAGNCEYNTSHEEGQLSLRHICPFCYAAGEGQLQESIQCRLKAAVQQAAVQTKAGHTCKKLDIGPPPRPEPRRRAGGGQVHGKMAPISMCSEGIA